MEIQKRKFSRKAIIITAVIALLAVGVGGYFAYAHFSASEKNTDSEINYDEPSDEQIKTGEQIKENSVNSNSTTKPNSGSDQASDPVPQSDGRGKISATMTSANQNGAIMQIRYYLGGVTNEGTCTLTLKKGSSTVTKTAGVQALAGGTTCKGFDIPVSELSVGNWQAVLRFENDSLVADTSDTVEVK